jgi:serine/threonine protein kinase/tetratricopeptide (TPR) repeat protein
MMGAGPADSASGDKDHSGTVTAGSSTQATGTSDYRGNERYEVVRRIGEGGMGVVYEALDHERGVAVALKTLLNFSPAALYRFKQEFRTLADVHHPNLVRLYELVVGEGDDVFFTMELVSGTDFLTFVHKPGARRDAEEAARIARLTNTLPDLALRAPPRSGRADSSMPQQSLPKTSPADLDQLRHALRQLVEGVMALHSEGKLHRDIKPSNVLVAHDGRVVVLDFGASIDMSRFLDENLSEGREIVGTVHYMAPEQAISEAPTPASDWYSVGVVLYEALVGRTPFVGSAVDVLAMKTLRDPPSPVECVEGVPPDLDSLCRALLDRDPRGRPSGPDILSCLGAERSLRPIPSPPPAFDRTRARPLVGREGHLAALRDGFDHVRSGHSVTFRIAGASGVGKSAVAAHFLDKLVEDGEAVVLRGRTYERESVPYKAFDGVIDALSRYLVHIEEAGDTVELPADIGAVARVFPVLKRVASIGALAEAEVTDPSLVRRRAFAALGELLGVLSARRPLIVSIDDAQWGDADSAALLIELVRPPSAPPVMFVLAYRDEGGQVAPFLSEVNARWPSGAQVRHVAVGPLETVDARRLALGLLGSNGAAARRTAEAIGRESGGSPFLVEELARSAAGRLSEARDAKVTLEQMVGERLAALPTEARRLVEIIAVGGRPLPVSAVRDAARVEVADDVIALLQRRHFVRPGLRDGREVVEPVHDRIRETIVAQLTAESTRENHAHLARALQATPGADPESVAVHLIGAGEAERGALFAERAAEQAVTQLAFDQAARLFRVAIETLPPTSQKLGSLYPRLGEVLGWAGRNEDAGRAYIAAADRATAAQRGELERAASAQLLAAGRIDEGGVMIRRVLASAGVEMPRSTLATAALLVAYKARLKVFGLRFTERAASRVSAADLARIDALHVAALGLASVDLVLATYLQARLLVESLRVGDRARTVRAATLYYGSHLATGGGPVSAHEREVRELLQRLVEQGGSAAEVGFTEGTHGVGLFLRGRWREAVETIDRAYANLPSQLAGVQTQAAIYAAYAQAFLGDLIELRRREASLLADAEQRGDQFTSVLLRVSQPNLLWLAADDPDGARAQINEAKAKWSHGKFTIQDSQVMRSEVEVELYVGDGAKAYERLLRDEASHRKSLLFTVQYIRALTAFARGRAAIASIDSAPERRAARLTEARRLARQLERERMGWTAPLAALVTAAAANASGDRESAASSLRRAIDLAQAADMALYAAAARYQLGALLGGEEGAGLVASAEEAMRAQDIRVPARFAAMLVPGHWQAYNRTR